MLQLEKGSFVPLVFTTTGGMAPEAKRFIRRLAVLIATKTNEEYSQVMCNIRTRLSMDIMRSVLVAVGKGLELPIKLKLKSNDLKLLRQIKKKLSKKVELVSLQ